MIACSSVPAYNTVPLLIVPTDHGFKCGGCHRPLNEGGVGSQLWDTLDPLLPFCRASPQPALDLTPCIICTLVLLVSAALPHSSSPDNFLPVPLRQPVTCRPQNLVWVPLPKLSLCPFSPLDGLPACGVRDYSPQYLENRTFCCVCGLQLFAVPV